MEFMKKVNEIGKKVGETAQETYKTVTSKSGKFFEETKLKMSIGDKEEDIEKLYQDMGKKVYDLHKAGESVEDFEETCKEIDDILFEIKNIESKILLTKDLRKCENCGEIIEAECAYCSSCGVKQEKIIVEDKKEKEKEKDIDELDIVNAEEEPTEKICTECGFVSDDTVQFCVKCGHKLD